MVQTIEKGKVKGSLDLEEFYKKYDGFFHDFILGRLNFLGIVNGAEFVDDMVSDSWIYFFKTANLRTNPLNNDEGRAVYYFGKMIIRRVIGEHIKRGKNKIISLDEIDEDIVDSKTPHDILIQKERLELYESLISKSSLNHSS